MLLQGRYDVVLKFSLAGIFTDAIASELFKNSAQTITEHLVGYQQTIAGHRVIFEDFEQSVQAVTINGTSNNWRLRLDFVDAVDINDFTIGLANALGLSPNAFIISEVTPVGLFESGLNVGILVALLIIGFGVWVIFGE